MQRVRQDALEVAARNPRFWGKVNKTDECWLWTGALSTSGYGRFRIDGEQVAYAHRIALVWAGIELDDEMVIDHLCRIKQCVNPDHLEQVPQHDNVRRGLLGSLKTHCRQGHEWTEANQYIRPDTGQRMCLPCRNERNAINNKKRAQH